MKHGYLKNICCALTVCGALAATAPAMAVTYTLRADRGTVTMPDGQVVTVWGFADDSAGANTGTVAVPGPQLAVTSGDTLTVILRNNLPVPVSLVIPGQPMNANVPAAPINDPSVPDINAPYNPFFPPDTIAAIQPAPRARSFSIEAAPGGGTQTYNFGTVKDGTFLYESGTSPALQIPMGLYGALVVGPGASGLAYPITPATQQVAADVTYDRSQVLVFSDIPARYDFGLGRFVAMSEDVDRNSWDSGTGTWKTTLPYPLTRTAANEVKSTLDYQPLYYLINGKSYPDTIAPQPVSAAPGAPTVPGVYAPFGIAGKTLLRIINASGKDLVPTIQGSYQDNADPALSAAHSLYPRVIAEDGNLYPYAKQEFAPILPAGKTLDVMIDLTGAAQPGYYTLYDRRLGLTNAGSFPGGMLTFLASWDPAAQNCSPFKGDLNGDGKINILDAVMALQAVVSSTNLPAGDVSPVSGTGLPCGDGSFGTPDALFILQKAVGLNPY